MNKIALILLPVFAAALLISGCEKKEEQPAKVRQYQGPKAAPRPQADDGDEAGGGPVITGVKCTPEKPMTKDTIRLTPEVEADNPAVVSFLYDWKVNGESVGIIANSLSGEYFAKDDEVTAVIIPSDDNGEGDAFEFSVTIVNTPPEISSRPPSGNISGTYRYQVVVKDPDDDEITYSLSGGPSGMEINSAGLIEWPLDPEVHGNYDVEIKIADPSGDGVTQTFNLNLGE